MFIILEKDAELLWSTFITKSLSVGFVHGLCNIENNILLYVCVALVDL